MPFKCIQSNGKWLCITEDTGKVHGKHDSKGQCLQQMRALYANVPEASQQKG